VTLTIRRRLSMTNDRGICSPSAKPFAAATLQLLVAIALCRPLAATALALPASQTLNRTSGFPGTCNMQNCSALRVWPAVPALAASFVTIGCLQGDTIPCRDD